MSKKESNEQSLIDSRQKPEKRKRPITAAFRLDPTFYDELLLRLEREREKANQFFKSIKSEPQRDNIRDSSLSGARMLEVDERYPVTALPGREQLAILVEKAFWTSLQREEGRLLRFSIIYGEPPTNNNSALRFSNPLSFNIDNLTKLGPSVKAELSAIAVWPSDKETLNIWGLFADTLPMFRIKVLDPGLLIISFSRKNVSIISGDEAVFVRNNVFSRSMWTRLQGSTMSEDYSPFIDPKVEFILSIARAMRSLGHGGTLLIVPDDERWNESHDHSTYPVGPRNTQVSSLLREIADNAKAKKDEAPPRILQYSVLTNAIAVIAQLTAVDGATVITTDMDIVGFGVKIKEDLAVETFPIIEIDPLDHENDFRYSKPELIGGKRHQSAARFIYKQHDAIALVASQDGNITVFVWKEYEETPKLNSVHAYRRLELTLF